MELENIILSGVTQSQKRVHTWYVFSGKRVLTKILEYIQYNSWTTERSVGRKTKEMLQYYI